MQNTQSPTIRNLEAAFAGESMAHIKYLWFARQCRKAGDEATARVFEDTAAQEMLHAFGHAELLFADETMTPARCLQYAIEGETHEYTEMYPTFRHEAMIEGNSAVVADIDEQIAESKEHAERFKAVLDKAAKRFAALAKVEERHAKHYQAQKDAIAA
ncbi:rubrerythrin family protein [Thiobacillus sedimenti]|uniref:Rubrerythrin family protein n=1 Tax=Thiobacillus sedimenti TaxID=3110231 RepID=A0ABZ1CKG9_9PROT|nr:rubrerythrin family protein [Thiobacillus sp. SCUT-2]WRS38787.1 rubrerythrin family protein [Thiobacillus sp. SCUT-2]